MFAERLSQGPGRERSLPKVGYLVQLKQRRPRPLGPGAARRPGGVLRRTPEVKTCKCPGQAVGGPAPTCGVSPLCALRLRAAGRQGHQSGPGTCTVSGALKPVGGVTWAPRAFPSEGAGGFRERGKTGRGPCRAPRTLCRSRPRRPGKNSAESQLFPLAGPNSSRPHIPPSQRCAGGGGRDAGAA